MAAVNVDGLGAVNEKAEKASMGWRPASTSRLVVSLLLPAEDWLLLARQKRNMWPMQMTTHTHSGK